MKKTLFTLSAILWVFSTNTDALAHSTNQTAPVISIYNTIEFPLDDGANLSSVTRRYGGNHYRNNRHGGQYRSPRFGHREDFRFNSYRPYYRPYNNYSQRHYRGHNNFYRGGRHYGYGNLHRQNSHQNRGRHSSRGYGHSGQSYGNH
ncbi:hypothetical protein MNBD_NITROSPINAE05-351 [hydrothermal vent metagenome]|uniref:Uncharacterized protein n=1 Tax=hydrothermal vent metagenome TaxID=652676 RepID=A0A3B1CKL3_9ZZZZ